MWWSVGSGGCGFSGENPPLDLPGLGFEGFEGSSVWSGKRVTKTALILVVMLTAGVTHQFYYTL